MKLLGTPILHWLTCLTWTLWTLLMIFPSFEHLVGTFFRTLALKSKHRVWNMWPQLPISVEADVRREDFLSERGAWQNMQRTWDFNLSVNWKSETWSSMQFLHEEQEQFILSFSASRINVVWPKMNYFQPKRFLNLRNISNQDGIRILYLTTKNGMEIETWV